MRKKKYASVIDKPKFAEFQKQIGRITANFGLLETLLLWLFHELLKSDDSTKSGILYYSMNIRARLDIMQAIAPRHWKHKPEVLDDFTSVLSNVRDATSERNNVAHCIWGVNKDEPNKLTAIRFRSHGGSFKHDDRKETVASLSAKADKIAYASQAVMDLLAKIGSIPPLTDTSG